MATQSSITVSSILRSQDNTIKVIKVINRPYIKQFSLISKKSTTDIQPSMYVVKIESNTPKITPSSKIKVYCSCLDFRYRLAYCFDQHGALLTQPDFVLEPPKETNPTCTVRSCKHINVCLRYAIEKGI